MFYYITHCLIISCPAQTFRSRKLKFSGMIVVKGNPIYTKENILYLAPRLLKWLYAKELQITLTLICQSVSNLISQIAQTRDA